MGMDPESNARPLDPRRTITIVSGLPRAGTSMMMQMLSAAGLELAIDASRPADQDNPRGYFELDAVRRLPTDHTFLGGAVGRVVKIVSPLLRFLPPEFDYRVIFMERELPEILDSQRAMLARMGGGDDLQPDEAILGRALGHQVRDAKAWLAEHGNFRACFISHAKTLDSPMETSERVTAFLASTGGRGSIDGDSSRAIARMAAAVDPDLHRQRSGSASSSRTSRSPEPE
jgi:hypothetical protein